MELSGQAKVVRGKLFAIVMTGLLGFILANPALAQDSPSETTPAQSAAPVPKPPEDKPVIDRTWSPPEVGSLADDINGKLIRRGRDLFTATYAHIGPDVSDPAKRFAGNNLACSNCHLHAGTKKFGLPVYGLKDAFPAYSARAGADITLPERLNSCMVRSMNGRAMPVDSPEMQALVGYTDFLSRGVPAGEKLTGYGSGDMRELDRAADPERGKTVYANACELCHGPDGAGLRRSAPWTDLGYLVPPLWGSDSFNNGAGMNRLITAANFLHSNMPHGTDYLNPQLSVEDAWDAAAYMVSQPRRINSVSTRIFPICCKNLSTRPMALMLTAFPSSSTNTGHMARSAQRSPS